MNNYPYELDLKEIIGLFGKPICRKRVGNMKSLSLGFGERIVHARKSLSDPFYGEWEIGTMSSVWRVVKNEEIVCGSNDTVDSIEELNARLNKLDFQPVCNITMLSRFDVRVSLHQNVYIDFLFAAEEDDDIFHIFGPDSLFVGVTPERGWLIGRSDLPSDNLTKVL